MSASALVGLVANLVPWRKGVRDASKIVEQGLGEKSLEPFDKGVRKSIKKAKGEFDGLGNALKSNLKGLVAGLTVGAAAAAGAAVIARATEEFNSFEDSALKLRAALATIPEGLREGLTPEKLAPFREALLTGLGIGQAQANNVMADFITRGFGPEQAKQLTVLAANYAAKTGKPLEDVARKIADAGNGSVDAIKELGVQITVTGDKTRDAEAAILALKGAYGSIGTELVDPSERLSANMSELYRVLGEELAPIMGPLVQDATDFVQGLIASGTAAEIFQAVGSAIGTAVEFAKDFYAVLEGGMKIQEAYWSGLYNSIKWVIGGVSQLVGAFLKNDPAGQWIAWALGIDAGDFAGAGKIMMEEAAQGLKEAMDQVKEGAKQIMSGRGSTVGAFVESQTAAGRAAREAAGRQLETITANRETFAGAAARGSNALRTDQQEEKRRASEAAAMARETAKVAAAQEKLNQRMRTRGNVGPGTAIVVSQRGYNPLQGAPVTRVGGRR